MKKLLLGFSLMGFFLMANGSPLSKFQAGMNIDSIIKMTELIPIMVNGDKDNRINIVIMNRWTSKETQPYNTQDRRAEFIKDIEESLIAALTPGNNKAKTVFANYRNYFNVYGLWWQDIPEWDKGVNGKTVDSIRDRLFLPWKDEYTGWVTVLVMPNLSGGGGGAARNLEERVGTALIVGNGIGKMLHEISHTCMSIGDEYTGAATGTAAMPTYSSETEYRRDKIKWRKWIDPETPLPTPYTEEFKNKPGAFEGNQYHLTGYYRSSAQGCIMGAGVFDNTEEMCRVCEQRVAMRVNKLVNPINNFTPVNTDIKISAPGEYHFAIDYIRPVPNTQVVRWILNGKTIATGVDEVDITFGSIAEYELVCTITDETSFIRPDPPYAKFPRVEVKWKISNSVPASQADDLKVDLKSYSVADKSCTYEIRSVVVGGKPPYTYNWSTGSTDKNLIDIIPGIYDLVVTDNDYRKIKTHFTLYDKAGCLTATSKLSKTLKSTSAVYDVATDVVASDKDLDNGKILLTVKNASKPYSFEWNDYTYIYGEKKTYEAEDAAINIPGHLVKNYFDAGNNEFVHFNGQKGSIIWTVEVANSGIFPIEIIYASTSKNTSIINISVNGEAAKSVSLKTTLPMYTGWSEASVSMNLKMGVNKITLSTAGDPGPNIDYLRVPINSKAVPVRGSERINLKAGNYTVFIWDKDNYAGKKNIDVPEVYPFKVGELEVRKAGDKTIQIIDPLPGYTYKWYRNDAPIFQLEKYEKPIATGANFKLPAPGNYYVSAKSNLTNGESFNRISIAIDDIQDEKREAVDPSIVGEENIMLWFDASDLDGDGHDDGTVPDRGPFTNWKEKTWRNPGKLFVKYEPNKLNGKGVGAFDNVWVGNIGKEVKGFQTIIMVYKESSASFTGKSPFKGLSKYIGKSGDVTKRIFDVDVVHEKTRKGKTFLNGRQVDPFNTPNPMAFCMLTVQLDSKGEEIINGTEGYWEGSIAELIIVNRSLTENERKGIEEYLRKKWFSFIDVDF